MDLRLQLRLREDQRGVPDLTPATKPHIHVACGALRDAAGRVLIVERPEGKIAALKWEFPGGKIEPGETPRAALDRELHEEIGIEVREARPLILFTHEYLERKVTLHTWLVTAWDGTPHPRERQRFAWQDPAARMELDVLPTVGPILGALRLPEDYVFTPPDADAPRIRARLATLPRGALLRLRLPSLDDAAYATLAAALAPEVAAAGLRLVTDRGASLARRVGAAGTHLTQAELLRAAGPPRDEGDTPRVLCLASCHDAVSLARAEAIGCDAAVLGSVGATSTHPGAPALGWSAFQALAAGTRMPVYGIGGLSPADKASAFAHYAQGVAGISAYWSR